ncbi:MAG: hypothetical protein IJ519_02045 [Clostridia bacterium]|nr:hypothetical protein [Clostridia bacterium]
MAGITVCALAVFVGGVYLSARQRTREITEVINAWEKAERSLYTFTERELSEEDIEQKCSEVCDYYSEELRDEVYQQMYDSVAEIATDARTVECYARIITDIRTDYRYGEIRAYMDCVIDYKGYGGYIVSGEDEDIEKRGKCTYTFDIEKKDDGYIITDISVRWDE